MTLILLIVLTSFFTYSQTTELCDENGNPIVNVINQIGIPNCLNLENTGRAKRLNDQSVICGECRENFRRNSNIPLNPITTQEKKQLFINAALDSYKKVLTDNLIEAVKIRTLQPTGSKFTESINACKTPSVDELTKGCDQETKNFVRGSELMKDLNQQIANELAYLISDEKDFNPQKALLKKDAPSCFISKKDLILITSRAAEESFTTSMLEELIQMDPEDFVQTNHMFLELESYDGDLSQLTQSLRSHPLLANYMDDPKKFIAFLKSIPSPRNTESLRATLYSQAAGDALDLELSNSCKNSLETLNKTICSDDFKKSKYNLDAFSNYRHLKGSDLPQYDTSLANNDSILNANAEALRYCDSNPSLNKIGLSNLQSTMNSSLLSIYKDLTFNEFQEVKYKTEIGNLNTRICEYANRPCTENTFECKVLQKYNDLKNSGSLESKLARSSNKEVNELLRSMIGDTSKIDPKTKEILIANGIIPRDDGTLVAQPDIPERTTEYFANNAANTVKQLPQTTPQVVQASARTSQPSRRPASSEPNYYSPQQGSASNQQSFADFSDILGDSSDELRSIQDEIRRRLSELPEARQNSREQAKQIVRDSFQRRGRSLTPIQENAIADRIMDSSRAPAETPFMADNGNSAAVSGTETELEKWRNGQRDAALMGMAGAQQVAAKDADSATSNESTPKDLTKVALNIPEDPQVKLSEVFVNKLNMNDSETQLLKVLMRNKSNFLLQINSLNFKIIFNDQNSFNLLLENGDRAEAERIRPQLEMFLRRLRL